MDMIDDHEHQLRMRKVTTELGRLLYVARTAKGISQECAALDAGISVPTYSKLERMFSSSGDALNPTLDTLLRVLDALDMPLPTPDIRREEAMRGRSTPVP